MSEVDDSHVRPGQLIGGTQTNEEILTLVVE